MTLPMDILVAEHKLILQAVELARKEADKTHLNAAVNPNFVATIVDFFRTYADRFHHGKEEGILFNGLFQKKLDEANQKMMNELVLEHALARQTVTALENAKDRYVSGETDALGDVLKAIDTIVKLYPAHVEKEDAHFFYPVMTYFSVQEQEEMLANFLNFNRNFTDKKYRQIINSFG